MFARRVLISLEDSGSSGSLVVFYLVKYQFSKCTVSEMEVAFLMSATSDLAHDAFEQMKKVVEQFIEEHGNTKDGYQIIIHDKNSHAKTIHAEKLQDLQKGNEEYPALHRNLKIAAKCFFTPRKSNVDKVRTQNVSNLKYAFRAAILSVMISLVL